MPVPPGFAGLVHNLFVELFTHLLLMMARIAERNRDGTAPVEPSEVMQPIADAPCEVTLGEAALGEVTLGEVLAVEQTAALPPPARPQLVADRGWPQWRGAEVLWTAKVGFLGVDSKKWGLAPMNTCVHFVTI